MTRLAPILEPPVSQGSSVMPVRTPIVSLLLVAAAALTTYADAPEQHISVHKTGSAYVVEARLTVAESAATARAVLTDYDNIARFMPGVRRSRVVAREGERVRVEQEAVSTFMLFSKTVHLLLDVEEREATLRFQDRSSRSFRRYEGSWTIRQSDGVTDLRYALTVEPGFSVPSAVLRKLLDRDAHTMLGRLRVEIAERGKAGSAPGDLGAAGTDPRS